MAIVIDVLLFALCSIHLLAITILLVLLYRSEGKEEFVTFKKGKVPEEHDEL